MRRISLCAPDSPCWKWTYEETVADLEGVARKLVA